MYDKYSIAFNTNFVSSLTGASIAQLNAWDKKGIISPSVLKSSGRGSLRLYSFKDIVGVKTIMYLRSSKVSLSEIKRAVEYLKEKFEYNCPLSETVLISNGIDILAAPQSKLNSITINWIAANKYGQRVMPFVVPLGGITQTIDAAIEKYNERIKEAEIAEQTNELIPLQSVEKEIFGVSGKIYKKRA